jgi:hypothetical protein
VIAPFRIVIAHMPRYFFDFRQGQDRCADAQGTDFPNVEQAYLEAVKAAQDMWSELLRQRQDPRHCVFEVRNGRHELLFVLPFQEVMDSCLDRKTPPARHIFESVSQNAYHAKRVSAEFLEQLHAVRRTLEESRMLLRSKV